MSGDSETNYTTNAIEKLMRQMGLVGLVEDDKMFQDPGIDLTTKPIVEQMRKMTRNRPAYPIGINSEVDGECEEYCPFMTLPNELITDICSLLNWRDRVRVRVNQRLRGIVPLPKECINARWRKVFNDPKIDHILKPTVEQMRKMTRNRPAYPFANYSEVDGEFRGYSPFLGLPNKLIIDIFSFLSKKERMIARVSKRLNDIEAEYKYCAQWMYIGGCDDYDYDYEELRNYATWSHNSFLFKEGSGCSKFIERISHNSDIGNLRFKNDEDLKEVLVDSNFLDISNKCTNLCVYDIEKISAEALHQVYKNMIEGSTKLRWFKCLEMKDTTCAAFLNLIGITTRPNKSFFSNRDVEAFVHPDYDGCTSAAAYHFFDGNLQIIADGELFEFSEIGAHYYPRKSFFIMEFHENQGSVEHIKEYSDSFIRLDISK